MNTFYMLLFCSLLSTRISVDSLDFKVTLRGSYDLPQANYITADSLIYFLIDTKLVNTSSAEKKFVAYNCTTVGNIVSDSRYIRLCINNCGSNYATTFILKPGQELNLPIIVQVKNENIDIQVKFGWIFMDYDSEEKRIDKFFENSRNTYQNIIWSNPIDMDLTDNRPFEIK